LIIYCVSINLQR